MKLENGIVSISVSRPWIDNSISSPDGVKLGDRSMWDSICNRFVNVLWTLIRLGFEDSATGNPADNCKIKNFFLKLF